MLKSIQYISKTKQLFRSLSQKVQPHGSRTVVKRPPVVTIMGHVDHGKTTLLDHLRNSQIVKQEFGGITQHIGAFVVPFKQRDKTELVTFLDTPGHAAFASMRQRGANVTDIVVLVVACEDGILEQTVESIRYARNSNVPIIVAINKIDKFAREQEIEKNIDVIRKQLTVHDVITEMDGGDVQLVKISALKGVGVEDLKESILALAETLELEAEISTPARGHVIESSVHPHRGKLCTVLVSAGQLTKGDFVISGTNNWAKIRALFDERQQLRQSCGPGFPIQITGWREDDLPAPGDPVMQVKSEQEAKSIIRNFQEKQKLIKAKEDAEQAAERARKFQELYSEKFREKRASGRRYGRVFFNERGVRSKESVEDPFADRKVNLLLKCDVDGSLEAIMEVLDTFDPNNKQPVKLDLMHYGVGPINQSDLLMASSFKNSVIYGFNVKASDQKLMLQAKQEGVSLKLFNVIYHLIDDLKSRLSEQMPELEEEVVIGQANILQEFIITDTNKKKIRVAGCRCARGMLRRDSLYRLMRNNEVIKEDLEVKTMKHEKDDAKEIENGRDCGISFLDQNDYEFKPGDILVAYEKRKYKPALKWEIKGF